MRIEGGTLYPGVDCPPPPPPPIDYVHRDEIGENVSSILLKSFQKLQITRRCSHSLYHNIKMKAYMRVEGGRTLYPGLDCPPLIDYVHRDRDKIGEIVSSILLKGIQKLQITRLFSIPLIIT